MKVYILMIGEGTFWCSGAMSYVKDIYIAGM
jgi:hypothetical protein